MTFWARPERLNDLNEWSAFDRFRFNSTRFQKKEDEKGGRKNQSQKHFFTQKWCSFCDIYRHIICAVFWYQSIWDCLFFSAVQASPEQEEVLGSCCCSAKNHGFLKQRGKEPFSQWIFFQEDMKTCLNDLFCNFPFSFVFLLEKVHSKVSCYLVYLFTLRGGARCMALRSMWLLLGNLPGEMEVRSVQDADPHLPSVSRCGKQTSFRTGCSWRFC